MRDYIVCYYAYAGIIFISVFGSQLSLFQSYSVYSPIQSVACTEKHPNTKQMIEKNIKEVVHSIIAS